MHTQAQTQFSADQFPIKNQRIFDIDKELDEAMISVTNVIALGKLVQDLKQNQQLSETEINALAKKHLATEHGIDLEDINEKWDSYISYLIVNANLFKNRQADMNQTTTFISSASNDQDLKRSFNTPTYDELYDEYCENMNDNEDYDFRLHPEYKTEYAYDLDDDVEDDADEGDRENALVSDVVDQ